MRATILTKAHRAAVSMMAKGCIVARVLPLTVSEVFLIFTTQLYACLCNNNETFLTFLLGRSIATGIVLTPNTPLFSPPVGSEF